MKVTFVLGMSGAGKSHYIGENLYSNIDTVIDYDGLRYEAPSGMDKYEIPTYTKGLALWMLLQSIDMKRENLAVECTGMTKVGQAFLKIMLEVADLFDYEVEIVYIRPIDAGTFKMFLHEQFNEQALDMLRDWNSGHPRFRSPLQCPYFPTDITIVDIDHSTLLEEE